MLQWMVSTDTQGQKQEKKTGAEPFGLNWGNEANTHVVTQFNKRIEEIQNKTIVKIRRREAQRAEPREEKEKRRNERRTVEAKRYEAERDMEPLFAFPLWLKAQSTMQRKRKLSWEMRKKTRRKRKRFAFTKKSEQKYEEKKVSLNEGLNSICVCLYWFFSFTNQLNKIGTTTSEENRFKEIWRYQNLKSVRNNEGKN